MSKRLRQQMEQPSVTTFKMLLEFLRTSCCVSCICIHISKPHDAADCTGGSFSPQRLGCFVNGLLLFLFFKNKIPGWVSEKYKSVKKGNLKLAAVDTERLQCWL
jgi:hypothetical protein